MCNFKSEEYDKLYDQAQATVDMDEKFKLYGQMQKILADEGASVFIEDPANLIAIKKGYTGFVTYPVSAIDLASIQVAE
jgi:peptide/nickel transport system substrate-binding protein